MTFEVNFFKQECVKVLEEISHLEHAVRNGVMTYAALIVLISEAEETYKNAYGRYADIISTDVYFNEQCQAFGGELENLAKKVKNGAITQVSLIETLQRLLNFSNVVLN